MTGSLERWLVEALIFVEARLGEDANADPDSSLELIALRGALRSLDRWSTIMAEDFKRQLSGELQGIGVRVGMRNTRLVVTLIASSLAEYRTPAHDCESDRRVSNWVQVRDTCTLNFRSEANHEYLCSGDGAARSVRTTWQADIDFSSDLRQLSPIRVSENGWAALVLHLSSDLRSTSEGDYKTDRWQFTARETQLQDLQQLASSIATLKDYCEGRAS